MHRAARLKTHALHRVMQRFPGLCPGVVMRCIDATIETTDPLAIIDGEAVYRVALPDGRSLVAVYRIVSMAVVTVMTTPCQAYCGNRVFAVTETTIERIRNVNDPFRNNSRRIKRAKRATQERFLRNTR
jgi:hypothetical protein